MSQEAMEKLAEKATAAPAKRRGPTYRFTFPASARILETDPKAVSMTLLTMEQELEGAKLQDASGGDIFPRICMAIVKIDDVEVNWGSGQVDAKVRSWSSKCRELLAAAFTKLHRPMRGESESFLGSMQTEV